MVGKMTWLLCGLGLLGQFVFGKLGCSITEVDDNDPPEPTPGEDEGESGTDEGPEDNETVTGPENQEDSLSSSKTSDTVPYTRFSEINGKYREAEARAAKLETENAEYKNKIAQLQPAPGTKPLHANADMQRFHEMYVAPAIAAALTPVVNKMTSLDEEVKIKEHSRWLESSVNGLAVKYPEMDKEEVINAYTLDPNKSIEELAKANHEKNESRVKKAVADYVGGKTKASEHKGGVPKSAGTPSNKPNVPKTFQEAGRAAMEFLRNSRK
ncbi:MAG: hypothetical protein QME51_05795 [Planctomycetota bacterium]|nr:hypothetical protein [Planctomycetota bacterium]